MKNVLYLIFILSSITVNAQTISRKVIATNGGHFENNNLQASYTIGETITASFANGNVLMTQGFQQPDNLPSINLSVKCFIQGYYNNVGLMKPVLFNQGVINDANSLITDNIIIELHAAMPPYDVVQSANAILNTNGTFTANFNGTGLSQLYYIVLHHRNGLQTWSANPILFAEQTNYDFSSASSQAYGNNQSEVESGVWALYSGDLNLDNNIDLLDFSILEASIYNFDFGYFATDLNGDGNVDLLDMPLLEANINEFVFSVHP